MTKFEEWCDSVEIPIYSDDHLISILQTDDERSEIGRDILARALPSHYASGARLADIAKRLGKKGLANYIQTKLPVRKSIRSGDLGEILATTYIEEVTIWDRAVRKLRWKDHREMPMRGDDVLAVGFDEDDNGLIFLKGESKSRATLRHGAVAQARKMLNSNSGLPAPHALAFFCDRLHEEGEKDLADQIDDMLYRRDLTPSSVSHMIFTFSGNDPTDMLTKDVMTYKGKFPQRSVGLQIENHQEFISSVYKKAGEDGNN